MEEDAKIAMPNPITTVNDKMQARVVDDDPQVHRFVADILRGDGWQVGEIAYPSAPATRASSLTST